MRTRGMPGTLPSRAATVELQVSSPPQALGTEVRVTGPDGSVVSTGACEVLGDTVRHPLADGLAAGAYSVERRVTSADGHPITGSPGTWLVGGAAVVLTVAGLVPWRLRRRA